MFTVTASDPDGDFVNLMNTAAPAGATFENNIFRWTAAPADVDSSPTVEFKADDGRGEPNSVITESATINVPLDFDGDSMGDDWEVIYFGDLSRGPTSNPDKDRANNLEEYLANTDPTSAFSVFKIVEVTTGEVHTAVRCSTAPGRTYAIEYAEGELTVWKPFANPGRGIWTEQGLEPAFHTFVDDMSADTTGGPPLEGRRFYRVRVRR